MGTPLFIPVIGADGISKGFDNTRIEMYHLGLSGTITDRLTWKSMITVSHSLGIYGNSYPVPLDQLSMLGECNYQLLHLPVCLNIGAAADIGDRFQKRIGGYTGISWKF